MYDTIIMAWTLVVLIAVTSVSYVALQALDFSHLFKKASTWQIRFLILVVSLALGLMVACGIEYLITKIIDLI